MGDLTQAQARELFTYDPETGWLKWRVRKGLAQARSRAGSRNSNGYRYVSIIGKKALEHRVIWLLVYGKFPVEIDHINRVRDDNRLINLREATSAQNSINCTKQHKSNTGFRGVVKRPGNLEKPYFASMKVNYKSVYLGIFRTAEEAGLAVLQARQWMYGGLIDPTLWMYK